MRRPVDRRLVGPYVSATCAVTPVISPIRTAGGCLGQDPIFRFGDLRQLLRQDPPRGRNSFDAGRDNHTPNLAVPVQRHQTRAVDGPETARETRPRGSRTLPYRPAECSTIEPLSSCFVARRSAARLSVRESATPVDNRLSGPAAGSFPRNSADAEPREESARPHSGYRPVGLFRPSADGLTTPFSRTGNSMPLSGTSALGFGCGGRYIRLAPGRVVAGNRFARRPPSIPHRCASQEGEYVIRRTCSSSPRQDTVRCGSLPSSSSGTGLAASEIDRSRKSGRRR